MSTSLRGVNLTGAEWAYVAGQNPVEGTHYLWVSHEDIDYVASKGVAFVRLLFSWEILQPDLNGDLAAGYESSMRDRVTYAAGKGLNVMIEPHGGESTRFARYKGQPVGSAAVPNSAFADMWGRLAALYQANSEVLFGLMNEPNAMSTLQWFGAAQAAIDAIRAAGASNMIMVPGNGFSQPSPWNDSWYDTAAVKVSNAAGWSTLQDPLNNIAVSVHTYFDADGGGGADDIADPDIIQQRLQPVVDWARAGGRKVHLGEFGANAATPGAEAAVAHAVAYMDANTDVMIGWAWWAYGPPSWWGGYHFTLCPTADYTVDDPKMAWLAPHFESAPAPIAATIRPTTATVRAPGDSTYTSTKTVADGDFPDVPAGTYSLKVATRTTYSDDEIFCVDVILENPSDTVDINWEQMTLDLRGHTLEGSWSSIIAGTTGIVTVTPTADTTTVPARNKVSFGLCVVRNTEFKSKVNSQVLVKTLLW